MPWSFPLPPMQTLRRDLAPAENAERQRLRDQFASAALTGLLASMQKNVLAEDAASHAYEVADAMMAAREVK